jgi:hypothetical protein
MNLRTRIARSVTGDQGIFVRRQAFKRIGGFREWPLFEDVDFATRLKKAGKFKVVRSLITISARRQLQYGVFRNAMLVHLLRIGFWAGISPFTLAKWYQGARSGNSIHAPVARGARLSPQEVERVRNLKLSQLPSREQLGMQNSNRLAQVRILPAPNRLRVSLRRILNLSWLGR